MIPLIVGPALHPTRLPLVYLPPSGCLNSSRQISQREKERPTSLRNSEWLKYDSKIRQVMSKYDVSDGRGFLFERPICFPEREHANSLLQDCRRDGDPGFVVGVCLPGESGASPTAAE